MSEIRWIIGAMCLVLVSAATAQDALEKLRLKYETEVELLDKPAVKLRDQYKLQLVKLKEKYLKAGELELALVVNGAISAGDPRPDAIVERPTELASLQRIFLKQKAESDKMREAGLKKLNHAYARNLAKLRGS